MKDIFIFKHKGISSDGMVLGDYIPTGYIPKVYEDLVMRGMTLNKSIFESTG
jgi:pilus assembly protein CpaF